MCSFDNRKPVGQCSVGIEKCHLMVIMVGAEVIALALLGWLLEDKVFRWLRCRIWWIFTIFTWAFLLRGLWALKRRVIRAMPTRLLCLHEVLLLLLSSHIGLIPYSNIEMDPPVFIHLILPKLVILQKMSHSHLTLWIWLDISADPGTYWAYISKTPTMS